MESTVVTVAHQSDHVAREKAKMVPGTWYDPDSRAYLLRVDTLSAGQRASMMRLFPEVELPPEQTYDPDFRPMNVAPSLYADWNAFSLLPSMPEDVRNTLYRYQLEDLGYLTRRMREDGAAYLGWSRGLGKTLGSIAAALELGVKKWVVVCPNSSKESVWRPEIEKWAGTRWDVINMQGNKNQRARACKAFAHSANAVLLVHYEGLRLLDPKDLGTLELIVVDEAHRLANGSASHKSPMFYKALMKLNATYRLAMSGSIVVNNPEDVFGALHWMYPDRYASKWRDWNNRFLAYTVGAWGREFMGIKSGMLQPMQQELGGLMCVRRKEDELPDLPDRIDKTLEVDLSPPQRKVYEDLAEKFIAELPTGDVLMTTSVLSQLTKLRQIATGLDLVDEKIVDSSKIDLAVDLVSDNLPSKTVVFAWHRATVRAFEARMNDAKIPCRAITGDTKAATRAKYVQEFQEDPDVKVIVATIKTLGEAVTLHAASDLIFLESSWTPTDMEQAADRVHRIGQTNRVTITNIVARDTVDVQRVMPTVRSKDQMRRMVLGGKL